MITNLSRDWKNNLTQFAVVGYDYAKTQWFVRIGRTVSGRPMERTDEAMIDTGILYFETSTEASRWSYENGYR